MMRSTYTLLFFFSLSHGNTKGVLLQLSFLSGVLFKGVLERNELRKTVAREREDNNAKVCPPVAARNNRIYSVLILRLRFCVRK